MGVQTGPLVLVQSTQDICVFSSNPRVPDACSPECIQDCAIGEEADEPVSHRDFMEEGLLGLHNVSVWYPEELHKTGI